MTPETLPGMNCPTAAPAQPKRKACRAGYSLAVLAHLPRVAEPTGGRMKTGRDFYELGKDFADLAQETFQVITLNTKNEIINRHLVSLGSVSGAPVVPRDAYRAAVFESATAVAFIHNHPSGDPRPSDNDVELTARLVDAGKILGIRVLDHVVIGRGKAGEPRYFSFVEEGLL